MQRQWVIQHGQDKIKILDLCTGSGAIAISLAKHIKNSELYALDISEKALEISKKNAKNNDMKIHFIQSNLFQNLKEKDFDIIVSNPPYIRTEVIKTLSKEVQKEPIIALDGGEDGLYFYRKIIEKANEYLKPNGKIFLEIGFDQKCELMEIMDTNFTNIKCVKDIAGLDRVIIGEIVCTTY